MIANSDQTPACEPVRDANHQGGEYYFIDKKVDDIPPIPDTDFDNGEDRKMNPTPVEEEKSTPVIKEEAPVAEINNVEDLKKAATKLMVEGKLKQAFELLMDKLDGQSHQMPTVLGRLSGLNRLEQNIAKGIAMNVPQQMAQITHALEYIIGSLNEEDFGK